MLLKHIFLGADHSFNVESNDPYWNYTIIQLLNTGYWVTLDYEAHNHQDVLEMLDDTVWQNRSFVPLLSVRVPSIQDSGPNLTIKIDDIDFNATNAGVWCLHHTEVTDSNRFTDWIEYGNDVVLSNPDFNTDEVTSVEVTTVKSPKKTSFVIETPEPVNTVALDEIKNRFETEVINDNSIGLDPTGAAALKPTEDSSDNTNRVTQLPEGTGPADVAGIYAETGESAPAPKKKVASKKTVK